MNMKYRLMIACLCSLPVGLSTLSAHFDAGARTLQSQQFPSPTEDVGTLAPGATAEREISGGESHVWRLNLAAGDYLRLVVSRKTSKLAASLFAPNSAGTDRADERKPLLSTTDNNVIFEHVSNIGLIATFSFIVEVPGMYRFETFLLDKNLTRIQYEVKIEAMRSATPNDRIRVAAEKAELEGDLVVDSNETLEGRLSRIAKYETSLALWRELGDRKNELRLLRMIGASYSPLGELAKTLKYHSQAIQIARELGDRYQEANLTLSFGHTQRSLGYIKKALDAYQQAW
jgi:tetratricopeptide (TPR) repeat protein